MKKLLLLLAVFTFSFGNAQTGMLNGTGYAPDITVTDLNGNSHNLYSYLNSGKIVVLELFSTTCGHCQQYAAGTENAYQIYGPSGLDVAEFIGLEVNSSTTNANVASFATTYGVGFPLCNDISATAINYQLYYTPSYYVIFPDSTYETFCPAYCQQTSSSSTIEGLIGTAIQSWVPAVSGCTDPSATNYDPTATVDDGSCNFTSYTITVVGYTFSPDTLLVNVGDTVNFAPIGGYHNAAEVTQSTWISNGMTPNGGFYSYLGSGFQVIIDTAQTYYYVCQPHVSMGMKGVIIANAASINGCTDPLATNYNSLATLDDGSCTYSTVCIKPIPAGLYIDNIIHSQAQVHWDNMSDAVCLALKYFIQLREVGTTSWTNKLASDAGLCNFGLPTTSKMFTQLTSNTTYEYRMKAAYCNTSGTSNWTSLHYFTTADTCSNVINFTASPGPQSQKVVFTWNNLGVYSMVRIKLRVDSISNPVGSDWQMAGGFGVNYPSSTVNKWGLTAGESYRGQARTWCDPNGGLYRSSSWTPLVFWTQPSSIRILNTDTEERKLVKITDLLGREVHPEKVIDNITLFYIYSDGTVKKRIVIE